MIEHIRYGGRVPFYTGLLLNVLLFICIVLFFCNKYLKILKWLIILGLFFNIGIAIAYIFFLFGNAELSGACEIVSQIA